MVNTFLPYPSFSESMKCLDYKRLGKQRVECHQILGILLDWPTKDGKKRTGWINHPAVRMWRGYSEALKSYMNESVRQWVELGKNNNYDYWDVSEEVDMPPWLGDEKVHQGHRQVLLYKDYNWYSQYGWVEEPKYDYHWPIQLSK